MLSVVLSIPQRTPDQPRYQVVGAPWHPREGSQLFTLDGLLTILPSPLLHQVALHYHFALPTRNGKNLKPTYQTILSRFEKLGCIIEVNTQR